ncbi:MAG TPA: leishmanolysin-related zinc metalloendopeptidase [Gemmatimonadaceae bacterium]|nr:leishmanolysin-related zinc metalloendopeptidase [Gemmatimonadaceae bacterium]
MKNFSRSVLLGPLVLGGLLSCGGGDNPVDVIGPPATITFPSATAPTVLAGTALPPLTIRVNDQSGRGVPNTPVVLSVTGGGTLNVFADTTDANGDVTGVVWTVGKGAVPQRLTVTATVTGVTATLTATIQTSYELDLRFFGPAPPTAAAAAFTNAAARITGSVIAALSNVGFPDSVTVGGGRRLTIGKVLQDFCGGPDVTAQTLATTRGVIIYATVDSIDGPGRVLGSAGPCLSRTDGLPALGVMRFDRADIETLTNDGRVESVVLHEMLHVIGLGTVWENKGLLIGVDTTPTRFTGPKATAACVELGGLPACNGSVPVEDCVGLDPRNCGRGSRNGHWLEAVFDTELMTPFIEARDILTPYSKMSIQSLADIGYTVNAFAADPYGVPNPSARTIRAEGGGSSAPAMWDVVVQPRFTISPSGVVRPIEVATPATRSVR